MSNHQGVRRAYEATIGTADDAIQGFMRDKVLQLPKEGIAEGGFAPGARNLLGATVFRARHAAPNVNPHFKAKESNFEQQAGLFGARAAQAGALTGMTAAGVALGQLTLDIAFGGQADGPEPNQLSM